MHYKILGDSSFFDHHQISLLSTCSPGSFSWKVNSKFLQETNDSIKALWEASPPQMPSLQNLRNLLNVINNLVFKSCRGQGGKGQTKKIPWIIAGLAPLRSPKAKLLKRALKIIGLNYKNCAILLSCGRWWRTQPLFSLLHVRRIGYLWFNLWWFQGMYFGITIARAFMLYKNGLRYFQDIWDHCRNEFFEMGGCTIQILPFWGSLWFLDQASRTSWFVSWGVA